MKESKVMRVLSRLAARYYLRRPDQAELILIKHPSLSDLLPALLNELSFRLKSPYGFRLTGLNIELTNRCNLSCSHCPAGGSDRREAVDMAFETFKGIIDETPRLRTLLPFQWGEPLLNPIVYDCVAYGAARGIRVMITTNGTLLDGAAARRLLEGNLTRLTVSFDGSLETHGALRGVDPDLVIENARRFRELRDRMGVPCALDVSMVVDEVTEPHMGETARLFAGIADRIQYIPRFMEAVRHRPCRELWRGVLVVLANGDVTLCCADVKGEAVVGNVRETPPAQLFNGPAMRSWRRHHGRRNFQGICRTCAEFNSNRVSPRFS